MSDPVPVSRFVQRLRELLDLRQQAKEKSEKLRIDEQMAQVIRDAWRAGRT